MATSVRKRLSEVFHREDPTNASHVATPSVSDGSSKQITPSNFERKTIVARDSFELLRSASNATGSPKTLSRASIQHLTESTLRRLSESMRSRKKLSSTNIDPPTEVGQDIIASPQEGPDKENKRRSFLSLRSRFSIDPDRRTPFKHISDGREHKSSSVIASLRNPRNGYGSKRMSVKEFASRCRSRSEGHAAVSSEIVPPIPKLELDLPNSAFLNAQEQKFIRGSSLRTVSTPISVANIVRHVSARQTQPRSPSPTCDKKESEILNYSIVHRSRQSVAASSQNKSDEPISPAASLRSRGAPVFFTGIRGDYYSNPKKSPLRIHLDGRASRSSEDDSMADYQSALQFPKSSPSKSVNEAYEYEGDQDSFIPSLGPKAKWDATRAERLKRYEELNGHKVASCFEPDNGDCNPSEALQIKMINSTSQSNISASSPTNEIPTTTTTKEVRKVRFPEIHIGDQQIEPSKAEYSSSSGSVYSQETDDESRPVPKRGLEYAVEAIERKCGVDFTSPSDSPLILPNSRNAQDAIQKVNGLGLGGPHPSDLVPLLAETNYPVAKQSGSKVRTVASSCGSEKISVDSLTTTVSSTPAAQH